MHWGVERGEMMVWYELGSHMCCFPPMTYFPMSSSEVIAMIPNSRPLGVACFMPFAILLYFFPVGERLVGSPGNRSSQLTTCS